MDPSRAMGDEAKAARLGCGYYQRCEPSGDARRVAALPPRKEDDEDGRLAQRHSLRRHSRLTPKLASTAKIKKLLMAPLTKPVIVL